jgi:hypothetical protein
MPVFVCTILVTLSPFAMADQNRLDRAERAEASYLTGMTLLESDPAGAREAFGNAATTYQSVLDDGASSAGLWFNLGNALLRAEQTGEAIVAYRRAERLDPSNEAIAANLAVARHRVVNRIEPDATDLSFERIAGWWHIMSPRARLWLALGAWIAFWGLVARRRLAPPTADSEGRRAVWATALWGTLAVSMVAAATLVYDSSMERLYPVGVLTNDQIVLRSGNGEGFGTVAQEPLREGVEFTILEQRPGWWRVELADGTAGWIPASDAKSV